MFENSSKGYQAKQEEDGMKIEKFTKAASTSRQWTALRNPRIVRVSRSLGGKDRHSKICTIRGLRDRRIRLSVPTAIQLYDLQDKLGLSQPSKVVDWLLEVTKSDIDKLPPLDIPQFFSQFHQQTLHHQPGTSFSLGGFYDTTTNGGNQNLMAKSRYWDIDSVARLKGKEAESVSINTEKGKCWMKTNEEENQGTHKLFHIGMTNSNAMTYNSYNMDPPSSLSLSQFGSHGNLLDSHHHNPSSGSAMQFSSSLSVGSSQLLFCPSFATPSSSLFTQRAPFMSINSMESDPRQCNNHIQFLSSSTSQLMPHAFIPPLGRHPITPFSSKLLDSDSDDNNNHSQPDHMGSACS